MSTKEKEEAKKAKKAKTPRTRKAKRAKTTETAPSVKYVASEIRTEVVPLCTQLVKAAIVDPPECISGYDMKVHIKQVEAKCEERLSRQRKRLCPRRIRCDFRQRKSSSWSLRARRGTWPLTKFELVGQEQSKEKCWHPQRISHSLWCVSKCTVASKQ